MKKKLTCTIVLATLLLQLCVCLFVSADAPDPAAKLDQTLSDILASASKQESIPVLLWLKDIPHEEIEAAAATYSGDRITQAVAPEENAAAGALPFLHTPVTDSAERINIEEETVRDITQAAIAYKRSLHAAAYETANTEAYEAIFRQNRPVGSVPSQTNSRKSCISAATRLPFLPI